MEPMDDSHIPEDVLARCAVRGFPADSPEITNHLIACDDCNEIYEAELTKHNKHFPVAVTAVVEQSRSAYFPFPTSVWAAAGALLLLIFMNPAGQRASSAAQVLEVAAVRGGLRVQARPHVPLVLRLDATGLEIPGSVQVAVVNDRGRAVWTGAARHVDSTWRMESARGFRPGRYWVRIPDPARPNELLREFQLDVQ